MSSPFSILLKKIILEINFEINNICLKSSNWWRSIFGITTQSQGPGIHVDPQYGPGDIDQRKPICLHSKISPK